MIKETTGYVHKVVSVWHVTVDAELEEAIWQKIEDGEIDADCTREEYEKWDDDEKTRFLAEAAFDESMYDSYWESDGGIELG